MFATFHLCMCAFSFQKLKLKLSLFCQIAEPTMKSKRIASKTFCVNDDICFVEDGRQVTCYDLLKKSQNVQKT